MQSFHRKFLEDLFWENKPPKTRRVHSKHRAGLNDREIVSVPGMVGGILRTVPMELAESTMVSVEKSRRFQG